MTHKDISEVYRARLSSRKGLSERSVRCFCKTHAIHKPKGDDLDDIVRNSVREVGNLHHSRIVRRVWQKDV